jgi:hypothetical protein
MREYQYSRTLDEYSAALKPGMTRREVERYASSRNQRVEHFGWVGTSRSALDDAIEIGHEPKGWVCMQQNVYVALEYAATEPHKGLEVKDSDRLVAVHPFRSDCLDLP